jgi:hypothetical protein
VIEVTVLGPLSEIGIANRLKLPDKLSDRGGVRRGEVGIFALLGFARHGVKPAREQLADEDLFTALRRHCLRGPQARFDALLERSDLLTMNLLVERVNAAVTPTPGLSARLEAGSAAR